MHCFKCGVELILEPLRFPLKTFYPICQLCKKEADEYDYELDYIDEDEDEDEDEDY